MRSYTDWRVPRGGVAYIAGCFVFASIVFILIDGGSVYTRYVVPCFLPLGIGLWLKHSWARWLSFCFFVLVSFAAVAAMLRDGVSLRSGWQSVLIVSSLVALWRWKVYPDVDDDFASPQSGDEPQAREFDAN